MNLECDVFQYINASIAGCNIINLDQRCGIRVSDLCLFLNGLSLLVYFFLNSLCFLLEVIGEDIKAFLDFFLSNLSIGLHL